MNNLDVFRSQPRDTKIKIHGRDAYEGMAKAGQLAARALDMLVPQYVADTSIFICPGSKDSDLTPGESLKKGAEKRSARLRT
jgi:hypothetical protein